MLNNPRIFATLPGTEITREIYVGMPCFWCNEEVKPGDGAQANPPLPAMHKKCLCPALAASGIAQEAGTVDDDE
jgi:hypothetical protein